MITIGKEAYDDFKRYKRDKEANSQMYDKLSQTETVAIPSSDIKVCVLVLFGPSCQVLILQINVVCCSGDLIVVGTNQRVPADMVMLRTSEKSGASFIRTDQLDGETDWKLRRAVSITQKLPSDDALTVLHSSVYGS
jgi:phospholipid-translocating ATPase